MRGYIATCVGLFAAQYKYGFGREKKIVVEYGPYGVSTLRYQLYYLYCKRPVESITLLHSHAKHKPNNYLLWPYVGVNGHTVGSTTELKAIRWASQQAVL